MEAAMPDISFLEHDPSSHEPGLATAAQRLVDALNSYVLPRRLRRYQADILKAGRFFIEDPADGGRLSCFATAYLEPKAFAYGFHGSAGDIWLISMPIAQAYAIGAVYFAAKRLCVLGAAGQGAAAYVEARLPVAARWSGEDGVGARIVAGHPNFAHFAWNELPALLDGGIDPELTPLIAAHEPIAPLAELTGVATTGGGEEMPRMGRVYPGVLFCPASEQLTLEAREVVTRACAGRRTLYAESGDRFVVWISLRTLYRHALNEAEVLQRLIEAATARFPDGLIFLDGYSLPADIEAPGRYDVAMERETARAAAEEAASLIQSLSAPARQAVVDGTGLSLPEAIAWAAHTGFYVAHHGTQQHKVGWLSAAPGVVHANPHILASQPAGWVQQQAEGAALPVYVSPHMVADCESPGNPRQYLPYFADYVFADADNFIAFALGEMQTAHAAWRSARNPEAQYP